MPAAARSYGNSSTADVKVFCPESVTKYSIRYVVAGSTDALSRTTLDLQRSFWSPTSSHRRLTTASSSLD